MSIYISVVSHGHGDLINGLGVLNSLSYTEIKVVIKSNLAGDEFSNLGKNENVVWLNNSYGLGFGENNNHVFNYCKKKLGMVDDDFFIVLNPDVIIEHDAIFRLVSEMSSSRVSLASINLFKDDNFFIHDPSIRKFPTFIDFVSSFIGLGNKSIIEKKTITVPIECDWASGAFLAFKVGHYDSLCGFDTSYFMYCEDIDICYRSKINGSPLKFYPEIKAIHLAKHDNRKFLSKHFFWHVSGALKFLYRKNVKPFLR